MAEDLVNTVCNREIGTTSEASGMSLVDEGDQLVSSATLVSVISDSPFSSIASCFLSCREAMIAVEGRLQVAERLKAVRTTKNFAKDRILSQVIETA